MTEEVMKKECTGTQFHVSVLIYIKMTSGKPPDCGVGVGD